MLHWPSHLASPGEQEVFWTVASPTLSKHHPHLLRDSFPGGILRSRLLDISRGVKFHASRWKAGSPKTRLCEFTRKPFLQVTVNMPPCKLWQIRWPLSTWGSRVILFFMCWAFERRCLDSVALLLDWRRWIKWPNSSAEGEASRRTTELGTRWGWSGRAELATLTKLTLRRPSGVLLSNVHWAIAGKSLLILIGGTHL